MSSTRLKLPSSLTGMVRVCYPVSVPQLGLSSWFSRRKCGMEIPLQYTRKQEADENHRRHRCLFAMVRKRYRVVLPQPDPHRHRYHRSNCSGLFVFILKHRNDEALNFFLYQWKLEPDLRHDLAPHQRDPHNMESLLGPASIRTDWQTRSPLSLLEFNNWGTLRLDCTDRVICSILGTRNTSSCSFFDRFHFPVQRILWVRNQLVDWMCERILTGLTSKPCIITANRRIHRWNSALPPSC